jgi:hypothetical protein
MQAMKSNKILLCQCGGEFVTEQSTRGNLADEHDIYRVHCKWCPASSRWLCHEYDCLIELTEGMGIRSTTKKVENKI